MARSSAQRFWVLAVALLAACSSGGDDGPPRVAATVGGTDISSTEVDRLLDQYRNASEAANDKALAPEEAPRTPLGDEEGRRFVLEYIIRLTVLEDLAAAKGIASEAGSMLDVALDSTSAADFAGTAWTKDDLKEGLEAGAVSKQLAEKLFPDVAVSDAEVTTHWEAVKDKFGAGWTATVRAAFLPTAQAGEQLRQQVAAGADFDTAAQELRPAGGQHGHRVVDLGGGLAPAAGHHRRPAKRRAGSRPRGGRRLRRPPGGATGRGAGSGPSPKCVIRSFVAVQDQKRRRLFLDWLDEQIKKADVTVDAFYGRWNRERGTVSAA